MVLLMPGADYVEVGNHWSNVSTMVVTRDYALIND